MGTPDFAVQCLKAMLKDEHFEIVGVVTQPDRPAGRKMQLTPSPVKQLCLQEGLRVISPDSVNRETIRQEVAKWGAEVAVVVAFGQILGEKFIKLFPFGAFNVHASLLPRWRGAAPIQRALEAGDTTSGVALQKVVKELDAGDVLGVRQLTIDDQMTAATMHDLMAQMGCELLGLELMDYLRGHLIPKTQDASGVTYAKKIDKSESLIDWNQPARNIFNKIRAFVLGPGTHSLYKGKLVKLHSSQVGLASGHKAAPGEVVSIDASGISVQTGDGVLLIKELQPESRTRMSSVDFVKGQGLAIGDRFGS